MSAPVKHIHTNTADSQQAVPNYVMCFLPFKNRDLYHNKPSNKVSAALAINNPIVVINDAVRITITSHKGSPTDTADATLLSGDINYSAAIAPGDHVMIWLMDDAKTFEEIATKVRNTSNGVNTEESGLKFIGRVVSVRQTLYVSESGVKSYRHTVAMAAFTELQTQIYFNEFLDPSLPNPNPISKGLEWFAQVSEQYRSLFKSLKNNGQLTTEAVIKFYLDVFMGSGPKDVTKSAGVNSVRTPNASFLIPAQLAKYLNLTAKEDKSVGVKYADILQRIFGVQQYSDEMFPSNISRTGRSNEYFLTPLKGGTSIPAGNFNNINLWSLIQSQSNPSLNEVFTALKLVPNKGILPCITLRQMPFTTGHAKVSSNQATFFKNLPRWKLDPLYPILNYNIGTSDAERFNFAQVYTQSVTTSNIQEAHRIQIQQGNLAIDEADILRSGPRIHMSNSDTDAGASAGRYDPSQIKLWADLIGDFFINGHLKMNGTITLAGIQEPISIGDNFEFDNKLFHIEGVSHTFEMLGDKKSFITTLALSHGYYINPDGALSYMSSQHIRREGQTDDLPGYTDVQRTVKEDGNEIFESTNTPNTANDQAPDTTLTISDAADEIKSRLASKIENAIKIGRFS